jgi:hypothetical protein
MASLDLHDWPLTILFAVLLAAGLALQSLPADHRPLREAAVCEKPSFASYGLFLAFH